MLPSDTALSPSAADIHITPDGRFLYGSERATHRIIGFAVDHASGGLTWLGSFPSEPSPRGFNVSPCGRFLLVAGQISNRISVYLIDATDGHLTKVAEQDAGLNPNWIEVVSLPPALATSGWPHQPPRSRPRQADRERTGR